MNTGMSGKIFLALLILFMQLSFSATYSSPSHTFRSIVEDPFITTTVRFTHDFSMDDALGRPVPVNGGGVTCNGVISVDPTTSSGWPISASDFSALSSYPPPPATAPINYNRVTPNLEVTWLHSSDYDAVIAGGPPYSELMFAPDPRGVVNDFSLQRVDYDIVAGDGVIDNPRKEGGVGVYCKGRMRTTVISPSGVSRVLGNRDIVEGGSNSWDFNSEGDWTVRTEMNGVQCFAALEKHPTDDHYRIYLYRQNQLIPAIPAEEKTVTVQNTQAGARFESSNPAPGDIHMNPGETMIIIVDVENTGDVLERITGVSATNGFMASPLPNIACGGGTCNGFNVDFESGTVKRLRVVLQAPAAFPDGVTTTLSFTGQASERTCSAVQPQPVSFSMGAFTVSRPPGGVPARPVACSITPPSADMERTRINRFNLSCQDGAGNPVACTGAAWSVTGIRATIIASDDNSATVRMDAASGRGALNADIGGVTCSATLNAVPGGIPGGSPDVSCLVSPELVTLRQNDEQDYSITCFDASFNPVPCGRGVSWEVNDLDVIFLRQDDSGARIHVNSDSGEGEMDVVVGGRYACFASITVTPVGGGGPGANVTPPEFTPFADGCLISPSNEFLHPGEKRRFTIMCGNNYDRPCSSVKWIYNNRAEPDGRIFPGIAAVEDEDNTGTTITAGAFSGSVSSISANSDNDSHCRAIVKVSDLICRDYT